MPFCLRSKRILTPSGSASASEMSLMWTLVGSAFAPAPSDTTNLQDIFRQAIIKSLLVSVSSMQSSTKSGSAEELAWSLLCKHMIYRFYFHMLLGIILSKCCLHASTLGIPTSFRVATAWRFKEDSVTLSKSISLIFLRLPCKHMGRVGSHPTKPHHTTNDLSSPALYRRKIACCGTVVPRSSGMTSRCCYYSSSLGQTCRRSHNIEVYSNLRWAQDLWPSVVSSHGAIPLI